jgi:hypothetical protein
LSARPFPRLSEVVGSATPEGDIATGTHFGQYRRLGDAPQAIRQWCIAAGVALDGVNSGLYGHWLEAWNNDRSQIRTDIFCLLKNSN